MLTGVAVKAICGLSITALFVQAAAPATEIGAVGSIERLTLLGALVIAVGVLWRALAEKDKQLISMTGEVTKILTLVMEAAKELRVAVDELRNDFNDDHHGK
jgi:hypothetical protein